MLIQYRFGSFNVNWKFVKVAPLRWAVLMYERPRGYQYFFCQMTSTFLFIVVRYHVLYMYKSTEICDETLKVLLKIFFRAQLRARFFSLFDIREIRGWTRSIEWYTISRTTSYFLRKWQKKPFSLNLSHLAQKQSTQSFKKEIKTIKKEF